MLNCSDVVQIPFPFSDLTQQKRRPVTLLTSPDAFGDFLVVAITSQQAGHDDVIQLQDHDIANGRLPKLSWIRATKLFSLNCDPVVLELGALRPEAFERIHGEICVMLGCKSCK